MKELNKNQTTYLHNMIKHWVEKQIDLFQSLDSETTDVESLRDWNYNLTQQIKPIDKIISEIIKKYNLEYVKNDILCLNEYYEGIDYLSLDELKELNSWVAKLDSKKKQIKK